jgi:hypothetical protein
MGTPSSWLNPKAFDEAADRLKFNALFEVRSLRETLNFDVRGRK